MFTRQRLFVGATILALCAASADGHAQTTTAAQLTRLHASDWSMRAEAYEQLRADASAMARADVRRALLDLLDREDRLIEETLRASDEQVGVSQKYGEAYGEYVAELGTVVDTFADWSDARQVCILARHAYSPQSPWAAKLAAHGKEAAPCLLQMFQSGVGLTRAQAAGVLVQVLAKTADLSPALARTTHDVIMRALADPHAAVRIETIRALGEFGGADMLGPLRHVADTDPAPEVNGRRSIRLRAAAAAAKIEQRVRGLQP